MSLCHRSECQGLCAHSTWKNYQIQCYHSTKRISTISKWHRNIASQHTDFRARVSSIFIHSQWSVWNSSSTCVIQISAVSFNHLYHTWYDLVLCDLNQLIQSNKIESWFSILAESIPHALAIVCYFVIFSQLIDTQAHA